MCFNVRPQPLELTNFPGLTLSNSGHDLQFSNQLVLLKSYPANLNLWYLYCWGKNMSSIYRNSKHHQTLVLIYTQLWAHHINLYMQIGEVNHEASDVILNSFCSYYAFNAPGPCAMCYTYISQQLYEVGFIFCNWGSTVQVGNQAVLDMAPGFLQTHTPIFPVPRIQFH